MNKCFITKLPSSIDNDNLPVLGQLRINWLKQNNLTNNNQRCIDLATNDSITVKVSGAHFTDSTLTSNLGNIKTITAADGSVSLYISNDADAVLTIDNKYSLTALTVNSSSVYLDIEDIKYCTSLTNLSAHYCHNVSGDISALSNLINLTDVDLLGTQVYGDISALSNLTKLVTVKIGGSKLSGDISALSNLINLTYVEMHSNQIYGDINVLSNKTNIVWIDVADTQISGDINAVSKLTGLMDLNVAKTQVSGDVKAISNLTNLRYLFLTNTKVSGDISAVSKLTNLEQMSLDYANISGNIDSLANITKIQIFNKINGLSLTGDMSKIPVNATFVSQYGRKIDTNFTWTAKGRQNATFLSLEGDIPFDTTSMDNMLIDQATCTIKGYKLLAVKGTRTSASDAAVTAIQNMGGTIAGVTKQA